MSWRHYQSSLPSRSKRHPGTIGPRFLALGVLIVCMGLFTAFFQGLGKSSATGKDVSIATVEESNSFQNMEKFSFHDWLKIDHLLSGPEEVRLATDEGDLSIELTFDPRLQRYLMQKLARHKVDWGGVAVIEPKTGAVLALGSHSEKEPGLKNLALRSTFPAASVFKMVSAAAAMEQGLYLPNSVIQFHGDMYGIHSRQILRDGGQNRLSLGRAFAKSANAVFGRLGVHPKIGGEVLLEYASRFGFNEDIPFGLAMFPSEAVVDVENRYQAARVAAGFGSVRMSPLHGAAIAGSALTEGKMMEPFLIRRVVDQSGKLLYSAESKTWKESVTPVTARKLQQVMRQTISEGTSQRWFRNQRQHRILKELDIGGKTGSLTGSDPRGWTEWFVGYAQDKRSRRSMAIAIVLVSKQYWRIKPSEFARDVFLNYFSPRPIMQASVGEDEIYGP